MKAELFVIGCLSLAGQVVLLRELNASFYGVELIYILALAGWLLGTGLGATAGSRLEARSSRLLVGFQSFPILLAVAYITARSWHSWMGGLPGAYLDFHLQFLGTWAVTIPVAAWLGVLFQWAARRRKDDDGRLARAYGWESLGAAVGGLGLSITFWWGLQNLTAGLLTMALASFPVLWRCRNRVGSTLSVICLLLVVSALGFRDQLDLELTRWLYPEAVAGYDSPYGRWVVTRWEDQTSVFRDGVLVFESYSTAAEELVHPALVQVTRPKRVLLLGASRFGVVDELQKYAGLQVDVVEVDPGETAFLRRWLPVAESPERAARVHLNFADPRRFLLEEGVAKGRTWDAVFLAEGEPLSGSQNRFYTAEFFDLAARVLETKGILAFALPSSENVITELLARRNASLVGALRQSFRDVVVLPGPNNLFIASKSSLLRDPNEITQRFMESAPATRLVGPEYLTYLYTNDRIEAMERRLAETVADENRDIRPICYRYGLLLWLARLFPQWINRLPAWGDPGESHLWVVLGLFVLLVWATRLLLSSYPVWSASVTVLTAGALGMILETVLLLHYQIRVGALYRDIGLLLTLFMIGLSVGAPAVHVILQRWGRRRTARGLLAGLAAVECLYLAGVWAGLEPTALGIALLLGICGFLVAGWLAYAAGTIGRDTGSSIGILYGADVAGGAVGALAGLLLIPWLGLDGSTIAALLLTLTLVGRR